jgi:hypothetical protein
LGFLSFPIILKEQAFTKKGYLGNLTKQDADISSTKVD